MDTLGAQVFPAVCEEAGLGVALGTWFPRFAGSRYSRPDATIVRMKIRGAEIDRSDTLPFP
jgi:hypothetical protein